MPEEKDINLRIVPPAKYLPWAVLGVAVLLVVFLGAATYSKVIESRYMGQGLQYKNTIAVSGEGKVVAKPDIGQVNLSVISDAKTVTLAQKDNVEKMNNITKAMKDLGIKEEDLKTVGYYISPRYNYNNGRNDIIGYEVSQSLEVKIRDLTKVGEILSQAAAAGANQVGSLVFTFDNSESLQSEARQKAVAQAKQKANDLAASLGISLGKITSFSESSAGVPVPMYASDMAYGKGGGGGGVPEIQAGQNEIVIDVYLTYEIY